jgi:hypothetical protein
MVSRLSRARQLLWRRVAISGFRLFHLDCPLSGPSSGIIDLGQAGDYSSCPSSDLGRQERERLSRVDFLPFEICAACDTHGFKAVL